MELKDLIIKNRSYRRFYENEQIPYDVLLGFVEQTRYIASARNAQPLKYIISNDKQ